MSNQFTSIESLDESVCLYITGILCVKNKKINILSVLNIRFKKR